MFETVHKENSVIDEVSSVRLLPVSHKHTRAAVSREVIRKADAEVDRFLQTQLNYAPTDNNRKLMLEYLTSHDLSLRKTAFALNQLNLHRRNDSLQTLCLRSFSRYYSNSALR